MLMMDKTASSIKRKVQLAKQTVDKSTSEAAKILAFAETEVEELTEDIRILETNLSDARFAREDADKDLVVADKVMKIASHQRDNVLHLISKFEADLEALLE